MDQPEAQTIYSAAKTERVYHISSALIAETSLQNASSLSEDQKIQKVLSLNIIHLEWLNIPKIENLEVFTQVSILYLQHNQITVIENLQTLINLEYLALNDNKIQKLEGLRGMKKLQGLNLANNLIEVIQPYELPLGLQHFAMRGNPVSLEVHYKSLLLRSLKELEVLDDENITAETRFKSLGIFPEHLREYAARMNHFRKKKEIQTHLQPQLVPVWLTGSQKDDGLVQMRQKTKDCLDQGRKLYEQQLKEQSQNFTEKIEVSRNIRKINEKATQELKAIRSKAHLF